MLQEVDGFVSDPSADRPKLLVHGVIMCGFFFSVFCFPSVCIDSPKQQIAPKPNVVICLATTTKTF